MLQTEDHPIKTIMDLSCLLRRAMEQEMEEFKLSSIQSRILGFLWYKRNHHEKAFQKELESEFKIRRSSVTSVIQGLEKHGLVEQECEYRCQTKRAGIDGRRRPGTASGH